MRGMHRRFIRCIGVLAITVVAALSICLGFGKTALAYEDAGDVATAQSSTYSTTWTRIYGDSRYDTMGALVRKGFNYSSSVILCTGEAFPDALSASGFAGILGCPIITTDPNSLTPIASSLISSLNPDNVYILGGKSAVSYDVADQVRNLGFSVSRIAGSSRVDTGLYVYERGKSYGSWSDTCILAKGRDYPDALSIAPYAFASKTPIFLSDDDGSLSYGVVNAIESGDFSRIIVLGGTGTGGIQDYSVSSLGKNWIRLSGEDRYGTSAEIVEWETGNMPGAAFQPSSVMSYSHMAVATGANYPDALVSSDMLGYAKSALLLVAENDVTKENIDNLVHGNDSLIGTGYIIGGVNAVNSTVENWLNGIDTPSGGGGTGSGDITTVYATKSGACYHRSTCPTIQGKWTYALSISDAKAKNLTACKVCKPPES